MWILNLRRNIIRYYVISFLSGLIFSIPIIVLFWRDSGLNMFQITFLQSLFVIAVVIFEVPTWYIADILGRKKSIIISLFFHFLWYVAYWFWSNFLWFLLAEILLAFAVSFLSWAEDAFIYDSLKEVWEERKFKKIMWNSVAFSMLAVAISSISWSFLIDIGYRSLIWLSVPFMFIAFILSFGLVEPNKAKILIEKNYLFDLWKSIKFVFVKNAKLKWFVLYFAIINGINSAALWFYQPYFELSSLNIVYFGILFASFQIFTALVSKISHNIENFIWKKYSIVLMLVLLVSSYFLMWNLVFAFSFGFAFLQQFVRWFNKIVVSDYINQEVDSSRRATILSVNSLFGKLVYSSMIPLAGYIADVKWILYSLNILWMFALVFWWLALFILYKKKIL